MLHSFDVVIISDDTVFSRMMVLELAIKKISASVSHSTEIIRNFKGVYVADADYISEKTAERLIEDFTGCILLFSYSVPVFFKNTNNVTWMQRPFLTADFLIKISDILGEKSILPDVNIQKPPVSDRIQLEGNGRIIFGGKNILLTKREYELLEYLCKNSGRTVSRDEAVNNVWNYEFTGNTNVVDVYIRYIREKIDEAVGVKLIYTVRNKGYMIK